MIDTCMDNSGPTPVNNPINSRCECLESETLMRRARLYGERLSPGAHPLGSAAPSQPSYPSHSPVDYTARRVPSHLPLEYQRW